MKYTGCYAQPFLYCRLTVCRHFPLAGGLPDEFEERSSPAMRSVCMWPNCLNTGSAHLGVGDLRFTSSLTEMYTPSPEGTEVTSPEQFTAMTSYGDCASTSWRNCDSGSAPLYIALLVAVPLGLGFIWAISDSSSHSHILTCDTDNPAVFAFFNSSFIVSEHV